MVNEELPPVEQKESIKLMRMSKGYQWEIKLLINEELTSPDETIIKRLEQLDKDLKAIYYADIVD